MDVIFDWLASKLILRRNSLRESSILISLIHQSLVSLNILLFSHFCFKTRLTVMLRSSFLDVENLHSKYSFSVHATTGSVVNHMSTANVNNSGMGAKGSFATSPEMFAICKKSDETLVVSVHECFEDGTGDGWKVLQETENWLGLMAENGRVLTSSRCLADCSEYFFILPSAPVQM